MTRHYGRGRTRKQQKIDSDMLHDIETRHVDNKGTEAVPAKAIYQLRGGGLPEKVGRGPEGRD